MIRYIDSAKMGRAAHGWLDSHFHFSFNGYYNPSNMHFGVLRVLNDDLVQPGTGFDTHPHANMEILSYVVSGELTHADSMGNKRSLSRGQVQYMSAGTGITHSEYNLGGELLRFLQIWIMPDKQGAQPDYGDVRFNFADRENAWLHIAAGRNNAAAQAPIKMHADINIYAAAMDKGRVPDFKVASGRQAYMTIIEGSVSVNGLRASTRDALEIVEEDIALLPEGGAHVLLLEMAKG